MDNPVEEHVDDTPPAASSPALNPDAVPVGSPLAWPIVDADGTLLFASGTVLATTDERTFLFTHFQPQRGDLLGPNAQRPAEPAPQLPPAGEQTVRDMHLEIGALIGMRSLVSGSAPMHPCRIIGFAPNHALFVTPPLQNGRLLPLAPGENVEIVAIASQAVFRFVCTVEAVCRLPFDYLVLSKPGAIRRLRERKSIRVHAHLAVRFGIGETGENYEGLGLAKGISALGMSLSASWTLGSVGERLRLAFRLKSAELDTEIETTAVIRNVQKGSAPGEPSTHGLELDQLDTAQQMAMKVFVFDRHDDVLYWSNATA
ncbi:flagellar brake protein [Paraburkholderia sp. Ac-20336]|uniref:flagellar brake protein n=1 Tax=unclassified Paraburkholderia TaxID=2615204 RepID=UPI00197F37C6|nr:MULTISPECIES: flagellar brake protein [unclassified Paraburkholderia]MBN3806769.1 flagellar brake protein [Paraburkholderia sp. Ac-20336]MBN3845941.1 flagellar brake protein [Paraburkholderia sp. Ac-20342]